MQLITALGATGFGVIAATLGPFIAQATAPDVAPWVSAGGATAAVGGLVYVARLLASGQLIAAPVAAREKEASEREKVLERLVEQSHDLIAEGNRREDAFHRFLINRSAADLTTGELRIQQPPDPRGDET